MPDVLTDPTSAHDPLTGYVPNGMSYAAALKLRASDPDKYIAAAMRNGVRANLYSSLLGRPALQRLLLGDPREVRVGGEQPKLVADA